MKKNIPILIIICVFAFRDTAFSQKLISNSSVTGVCYAGSRINRIYIPPPDVFFKKSGEKAGASITVIYTGFPSKAIVPVEYAVSILEAILPADTRIVLSASWEKFTAAGVLANSSVGGYAAGWTIDAWKPLAIYPVALAEKISGKNLNDSLETDITLRINSSVDWYYATDGNTSLLKYDLVTIVLHEVCHGLGFFDSMNTDDTIGWYGAESIPMIYDEFLENMEGSRLTDSLIFKNYSSELRHQLTGGSIFFNGPLLSEYTSGLRSRIYAPSKWDEGSSISHLDEVFTLEPNTLMTPFIDKGEAIHDPGKLTISILGDLGWINTRIIHKEDHDTEKHLSNILLSVKIASDTIYNSAKVGAVFSFDNFTTSDTLFMNSAGSDDLYNCTIVLPSYNREIQYTFFTEDYFGRIYRSPSLSDSMRYSIYIGTDTAAPVISHSPLKSLLEKVDTIKLSASATDNLGIDTVFTEYIVNEGQPEFIGLQAGKDDIYSADLEARSLLLEGGDSIRYRIIAVDSAAVPNRSLLPDTGYFTIHIEDLTDILESYATDFSGEAGKDFINDGFEVYKPSGFDNYGLNSMHPYESPEDNDKTIEYTSILRHPLKFNESGMLISFSEIVLVEPGEPGSLFGSVDFYDYVIIEGSADFGKNWFRLADGYDSRYLESWETIYNNSIDGINSTAEGDESMLHKHTIYYGPAGNATPGDTLLLRFRLFSDPYANGWGWIIEDLKINPLIDAVEPAPAETAVTVYPNPGQGIIRVQADNVAEGGRQLSFTIFNSSGTSVRSGYISGSEENVIDISDHPAGLYFIVLKIDGGVRTFKYSLIK